MANKTFSTLQQKWEQQQQGQALVLIAAALIGLLAFVGIAVDVGFVFARTSQLQAAVDAAALAGVVELTSDDINQADDRAERFLNSNNIPITDTATMTSVSYTTEEGETAYGITVTWPVELYFLRVIGWNDIVLEKSATAAFYPYADMQTKYIEAIEYGTVNVSTLAVTGPLGHTTCGDPYSPHSSPYVPGSYTYRYRIQIPESYYLYTDEIRVEIFDPDSYNDSGNSASVDRTQYAIDQGLNATANLNCSNDSDFPSANQRRNSCVLNTGEESLIGGNVTVNNVNPFWFTRVDKNRPSSCDPTSSYSDSYNTSTFYELSYYAEKPDGTVQQIPLVNYTGRVNNDHDTDLRWVSPGAVNYETPNGTQLVIPAGSDFTPTQDGFEITFDQDTPEISVTEDCVDDEDCIYLYLEVTATGGSSVNGFDIWAGPATDVEDYPSNVNDRNVFILDAVYNGTNPNHNSSDVVIYGIGTLPLNWNTNNPYDIPLTYLNPNYTGVTVYARVFDLDDSADVGDALNPPLIFNFDSLYFEPSIPEGDWFMPFDDTGTDPDGVAALYALFG